VCPLTIDLDNSVSAAVFRILVVDDEETIASSLAAILRLHGFAAKFCTDPHTALEMAKQEGIDLLISDVMMPKLSGIDLAIRVKEMQPTCRVMLFSGQADTVDLLATARELGHDFYLITKPIHPTGLLVRIKSPVEFPLIGFAARADRS
jgi:DNA-binding response OmpR family regulator